MNSQLLEKNLPLPILDLEKTARRVIEITKEQFKETGFSKAILGLSGGIDSALALAILVQALKKENVLVVRMPYKTSSKDSLRHAQMLIDQFEVATQTIDISSVCDSYFASDDSLDNARKGNFMARVRMMILYDLSAKYNCLVTGTGNKSEILLGYSTLWGDSAYGYNPLASFYKTFVWQLSRYFRLPEEIIEKAPSADLWQGQSDEQDLEFRYNLADRILYHYLDKKVSKKVILEKLATCGVFPVVFEKVIQRVEKNQFKREPSRIADLGIF